MKKNKKNILFILNDNPIDPLGVMYLIRNIDANSEVVFVKDQYDKRLDLINIFRYHILAFSTITGSHNIHNEIAKRFKEGHSDYPAYPDLITIMGGPHPTFFPKEALNLSHMDYICIGEGITAFKNFIDEKYTRNIINDYSQYTGILDPIVDVNKIETDRKVIYKVDNRGYNPIKNFMGSFGCPFNCSYCYNISYDKLYDHQKIKRVRYVDPNIFIREIKECINNYPTKFIYIQDDTFIVNREWFNEVTDLIKREINLPYHCHIRSDILTEEIVKKLRDTGCASVTFAIEDANEDYRKKYLNRKITNEKILYTSKLLHEYDIKFRIENMVGLPFNNLKNNLKTLNINYKCHPTIGWASLFQPFPNTVLGDLCKKENIWDGNIDNISSGFFDKSPLKIENKNEIERLQRLFSLGVDNYIMKLLMPFLIKLPLNNFYEKIYTKFKIKKYNELYK
jgi:anaerobic magnesium-protoporphyrin IX monomethyl ester cyclase